MTSPVETGQQALSLPAVQAAYAASQASTRRGVLAEHNHQALCRALAGAGVALGAYDHQVVAWLAGFEPQMVAVIAGWVTRAAAGGTR